MPGTDPHNLGCLHPAQLLGDRLPPVIARASRHTRRSISCIERLYRTRRTSLNVYTPDISNVLTQGNSTSSRFFRGTLCSGFDVGMSAGGRALNRGPNMSLDNDETDRVLEEERPGPSDLESALVSITLSDVVAHTPLVVEANTSLAGVIEAMQRDDRGTVLVVEAGKLVGIFTERDVLMKVAGHPIDLTQRKVSAFMTPDPVTLPADSALAFALNRMVLEGFRHIPLVDDDNRPVAVVSMRNLIEYLSDFFNRDVLNLPPDPHVKSIKREGA